MMEPPYVVSLMVTADQEHALRFFFHHRGWLYHKRDERPAIKEELDLFYKSSGVDRPLDSELRTLQPYNPSVYNEQQQQVYGPYQSLLREPDIGRNVTESANKSDKDAPVNFSLPAGHVETSSRLGKEEISTENVTEIVFDPSKTGKLQETNKSLGTCSDEKQSQYEQSSNAESPALQIDIVKEQQINASDGGPTQEKADSNEVNERQSGDGSEDLPIAPLSGCKIPTGKSQEKTLVESKSNTNRMEDQTDKQAHQTDKQADQTDKPDGDDHSNSLGAPSSSSAKQSFTECVVEKLSKMMKSDKLDLEKIDTGDDKFVNTVMNVFENAFEVIYSKTQTADGAETSESQGKVNETNEHVTKDSCMEITDVEEVNDQVSSGKTKGRPRGRKKKVGTRMKVTKMKEKRQKVNKMVKTVKKNESSVKKILKENPELSVKEEENDESDNSDEESFEIKLENFELDNEETDTELYDYTKLKPANSNQNRTKGTKLRLAKQLKGKLKATKKVKRKIKKEKQTLDMTGIWTKESRYGINRNLRLHSYHRKCKNIPTDLDADSYSVLESGYYCPDCNFIFKKKNKLAIHKKLKAGDVCVADCIYCDAEENKNVFQCLKCPKVFETKELLERHVEKHNTDIFTCNFCDLGFYTIPDLKFHMQQEHGEEIQQTFLCDLCGSKFKEKKILNAHRKYVHTNERPEECPTCSRRFKTKSQLKNHLVTHKNLEDLNLSCEVCGKMFARAATLKDHVRRHKKEFTFFCEVCNKGFYRKHGMEEHMRTHTGDKPYDCKFCGFKCALSCNLVKHERIHRKQGLVPKMPESFCDDALSIVHESVNS